jgi:hypothetical protein
MDLKNLIKTKLQDGNPLQNRPASKSQKGIFEEEPHCSSSISSETSHTTTGHGPPFHSPHQILALTRIPILRRSKSGVIRYHSVNHSEILCIFSDIIL